MGRVSRRRADLRVKGYYGGMTLIMSPWKFAQGMMFEVEVGYEFMAVGAWGSQNRFIRSSCNLCVSSECADSLLKRSIGRVSSELVAGMPFCPSHRRLGHLASGTPSLVAFSRTILKKVLSSSEDRQLKSPSAVAVLPLRLATPMDRSRLINVLILKPSSRGSLGYQD